MQLHKAERKQAKIRIGLFGPSGSGKTMSALLMANGITSWDKVAMIDTENGSGELYSHLGAYNVLTLQAPFTPEKYIEAIKTCENAGMEVIIIDSITHEWAGQGGILEIADDLGKAAKNSFAVWGKLTPRHNKFIETILQSSAHLICCGRSKQEYALNEVEKNGKKVNVPEKIGLKAITREGFDYEMTISFDLMINHYATTSKDRSGLFMDHPEFIVDNATGQKIKEWNNNGKIDQPTEEQNKRMAAACLALGASLQEFEQKTGKKWNAQSEERAEAIIQAMEAKAQNRKPAEPSGMMSSAQDKLSQATATATPFKEAETNKEPNTPLSDKADNPVASQNKEPKSEAGKIMKKAKESVADKKLRKEQADARYADLMLRADELTMDDQGFIKAYDEGEYNIAE